MREGLELVIERAFRELGLHRLEANIQPGNRRSIALVEGLGFRREGTARGLLEDRQPLARPRALGVAQRGLAAAADQAFGARA